MACSTAALPAKSNRLQLSASQPLGRHPALAALQIRSSMRAWLHFGSVACLAKASGLSWALACVECLSNACSTLVPYQNEGRDHTAVRGATKSERAKNNTRPAARKNQEQVSSRGGAKRRSRRSQAEERKAFPLSGSRDLFSSRLNGCMLSTVNTVPPAPSSVQIQITSRDTVSRKLAVFWLTLAAFPLPLDASPIEPNHDYPPSTRCV
ncbi:hypothetical protein BDZ45DRAFT_742452 [Acephala macrosclerotiorum]|nr:hypothetical protein BDZ45DRAFT_742452 [Acephala macrosclerotiorum]